MHFDNQTDRFIDSLIDEQATSAFDSDGYSARFELGYKQPIERYNVTPFAGMAFANLDRDGFTEDSIRIGGGLGGLGLTYNGTSHDSLTGSLGVQLDTVFMAELRANTSLSARALELMILTAARRGEVLGASWAEIDLDAAIWEIPPERMKAGVLHRVPLSAAAVALLADLPRIQGNDYVFPGRTGRPLAETAVRELLKRMGRTDITGHGFRSTFRDWVAEQTNFQRELAEVALAHSVGSETERAYQRGDLFAKRRQLMDGWTDYINVSAPTAKQLVQAPTEALSS